MKQQGCLDFNKMKMKFKLEKDRNEKRMKKKLNKCRKKLKIKKAFYSRSTKI